jgi:hypothetical protein
MLIWNPLPWNFLKPVVCNSIIPSIVAHTLTCLSENMTNSLFADAFIICPSEISVSLSYGFAGAKGGTVYRNILYRYNFLSS